MHLDIAAKTVRHYTTLVPYQRIVGIARAGSNLIYVSVLDGVSPRVALCVFNAATCRWRVLADCSGVKLRSTSPVGWYYLHPSYVVSMSSDVVAIASIRQINPNPTVLIFRLKRVSPYFVPAPLNGQADAINAIKVTANSVWVGADSGLYRFDARRNNWTHVLKNNSVSFLCNAEDGSIWALASPGGPTQKQLKVTPPRTIVWNVMHFIGDRVAQSVRLRQLDPLKVMPDAWAPVAMVYAKGNVWIVHDKFSFSTHQASMLPAITRIDPSACTIERITDPPSEVAAGAEYWSIPSVVLAAGNTDWMGGTAVYMPKRFAGWICPMEEHDDFVQYVIQETKKRDWQAGWTIRWQNGPGQFAPYLSPMAMIFILYPDHHRMAEAQACKLSAHHCTDTR